jgi:hypothetical protein
VDDHLKLATQRLDREMKPAWDALASKALDIKNIWSSIVDVIAAAVGYLNRFVNVVDLVLAKDELALLKRSRETGGSLIPGIGSVPENVRALFGATQTLDQTKIERIAALERKVADLEGRALPNPLAKAAGIDDIVKSKGAGAAPTLKADAEARDAWDRAIENIDKHIARVKADTIAVGLNAGQQATLRAEFTLLEAAKVADKGVTDDQIEKYTALRATMGAQQALVASGIDLGKQETQDFLKKTEALGQFQQALEKARVANQIKFDRETLFLSPENVQIAQQLKGLYPDVATALNSSEAAAMRLNNNMKFVLDTSRNVGAEIGKSIIDPLLDGKNVFDSMNDAAKQLTKTLANAALKDLMSGNWEKALLEAVMAAVIKAGEFLKKAPEWLKIAVGVVSPLTLLGSMGQSQEEKAFEEAQKKFAGMTDEVHNFNAVAEGFDLSSIVSAMQQIAKTGQELFLAAVAANNFAAAIQIAQSGMKQINNQVDQFIKPKGNDTASQIAGVNNEAQQIIAELNDLNAKYGLGLNRTAEILGAAANQIAEIQKKAQEEIEKRGRGFDDRLFAATNDTSTLAGQLAAFERDAQRQREQEIADGGQNMLKLQLALEAERFNIVKDFGDKAIAESKRAAQEQLDAQTRAAKGIVDYLNNLKVGPDSTLSPTARLAAAQSTYNSILALAQGGNVDALARITQDAENYRKAGRDVYASGTGYQNILTQITSQLQGLPAVATSSDPVVKAVLGTTDAVNTAKLAIDADKVAVTAKLDTTIGKLDTTIGKLDTSISKLTDVVSNTSIISTMNSTTLRIINAINKLGEITDGWGVRHDAHLGNIDAWTFGTAVKLIGAAPSGGGGSGPFGWLGFAHGGIAQPGQSIIYGEHHPQGPFFGRVGAEPIAITPAMPSFRGGGANDNSELLAEVKRLNGKIEHLEAVIAGSDAMTRKVIEGNGDKVKGAVESQTDKRNAQARQSDRVRKTANG